MGYGAHSLWGTGGTMTEDSRMLSGVNDGGSLEVTLPPLESVTLNSLSMYEYN